MLNDRDDDEFPEYLREYAKLMGVGQREMAGFAGGLLAQRQGPTTAATMKQQAGKVFATLEVSREPVAHLLPMTIRAQAQGFTAQEASQTVAMMPEIAPEEEGTYLLRAVSALREPTQKGQREEFGLRKGMTLCRTLTTAVENIKRRSAAGEHPDDLLARATNGEEVSGRTPRIPVNQGPKGFACRRRVMEAGPDNQLDMTIWESRRSDAGKQYAVDSRLEVERART